MLLYTYYINLKTLDKNTNRMLGGRGTCLASLTWTKDSADV